MTTERGARTHGFLRLWLWATGGAAFVATAADAALLQRARSYFTGGFLAVDTADTWPRVLGFFTGSFVADAGTLGPLVALGLLAAARLGVSRRAAGFVVGIAALIPVAMVDLAEYELASYFGDAFNVPLLFELAGRDTGEALAVSAPRLAVLAAAVLPVALALVWGARRMWRRMTPRPSWPDGPRLAAALALPAVAFVVAAGVTTWLRTHDDAIDNGLRRKPSGQWLGSVVNLVTDLDRDGAGLLGRPPDPRLFDSRVRPYALDEPGNGVDENGVGGDLPPGPAYTEPPPPRPDTTHRPDIVLFVLESFRADAVGARVGDRGVTPVLDGLVQRGVRVQAAYSHNGYTVQARHHIFTGSVAGIRQGTLVDDFNAAGYQTAYFSGQDESFGGPAFDVGFGRADVAYDARQDRDRRYSQFSTAGSLAVPAALLIERIESFLSTRDRSRPLFLYVNFHDTHFPYHHPGIEPLVSGSPLNASDIVPGRAADLKATYLNTAANVDRAIGRVVGDVTTHLGRVPGVVVLGDHGESLFDEGFLGHGYALNDAQTRIPLIAAGLPITLPEPFGQADLRDAFADALMRPLEDAPRVVRDPNRRVFQYLGNVARPAQVAFTGLDRSSRFDFRERRARFEDGPWVDPSSLTEPAAARWLELVRTWERMMLARREARPGAAH